MLKPLNDPYKLQRLSLLPVIDSSTTDAIVKELARFSEVDLQSFFAFIIAQGLHFFWLDVLKTFPTPSFLCSAQEQLKQRCFNDTTNYLAQKRAILELDTLFASASIPYAVLKGAHIREQIYPNPTCRPSIDIDVLVSPTDKTKAVQLLAANNYTLFLDPANVVHEVSLSKDKAHIDLHWHIMRPGRTRIELTDLFLQARQRFGYYWALDREATLLIMLTHPVFTKYSTTPHSALVRLVDLKKWIETEPIDWDKLHALLQDAGLKTAAWITITYSNHLTGCQVPKFFLEEIRPGISKRLLLVKWLELNLSSKLANYPIFPKYIFSLLAHDSVKDIFGFARKYREDMRSVEISLEELRGVVKKSDQQ